MRRHSAVGATPDARVIYLFSGARCTLYVACCISTYIDLLSIANFTEETFAAHEAEIQRLQSQVDEMRPLLEKVNHHRKLIAERKEVEVSREKLGFLDPESATH